MSRITFRLLSLLIVAAAAIPAQALEPADTIGSYVAENPALARLPEARRKARERWHELQHPDPSVWDTNKVADLVRGQVWGFGVSRPGSLAESVTAFAPIAPQTVMQGDTMLRPSEAEIADLTRAALDAAPTGPLGLSHAYIKVPDNLEFVPETAEGRRWLRSRLLRKSPAYQARLALEKARLKALKWNQEHPDDPIALPELPPFHTWISGAGGLRTSDLSDQEMERRREEARSRRLNRPNSEPRQF